MVDVAAKQKIKYENKKNIKKLIKFLFEQIKKKRKNEMKMTELFIYCIISCGSTISSFILTTLPGLQFFGTLVGISVGLLTWYKYIKYNERQNNK